MARFFVGIPLQSGEHIALPDRVVRHLQVLRMREGESFCLFNGQGGEYHAVLTALGRHDASCQITHFDMVSRESPLRISLAQAISSGDRMDFTLQKGVEMGVSSFQPLAAQRSVVKLVGERADKRVQRWQEIVIAACEQSGRTMIPEVHPILSVPEWLQRHAQADQRLLLSPLGTRGLAACGYTSGQSICLMSGPEGGYTVEEEQAALATGCLPIKLGMRILRTETAALAAVAALQTLWGDYAV